MLSHLPTDHTVRNELAQFCRSYYDQHGDVPSISAILKELGLNRAVFYKVFPDGLSELCRVADIPTPQHRIQSVQSALESRKEMDDNEGSSMQQLSQRLSLSPEATRRVYGICQLEGEAEPASVIDKLLNLDTKMRRNYKLSLGKVERVSEFLDMARARGWTPDSIVNYITHLWNLGIQNLSQDVVAKLILLVQKIDPDCWGSIENFLKYITAYRKRIESYRDYLLGKIPLQQLLQIEGV